MRSISSISVEAFFIELLNMAVLATWIMLAVLLFRAILKPRLPRRIILLGWLLVAIRLVCPFTFESVISLIPGGTPIPSDMPYSSAPTVQVGIPLIDRPVNDLLTEHMTPTPGADVRPLQTVFFYLFWVWLAGVAALLIYTAISYILLRLRVRTAVKTPYNREALPRRATLWQSERVETPFILGILNPRIYLPFGMDEATTAHVLAHESAHLRRLDHITKLLAFLLCTVYWFHPLVWVCYALFCRDMEAACDESVIRNMDDANRRAYARALLTCGSAHRPHLFCPPAFGESDVKSRVKGVLSYKKPLLWLMIVAILLLAVLGVFLLTDPVEKYSNVPSDWTQIEGDPVISTMEGLTVTVLSINCTYGGKPTSIDFKLDNQTGKSIYYGEAFQLLREENGQWVNLMEDYYFNAILNMLDHNTECLVTEDVASADLSIPGNYRFILPVSFQDSGDEAANSYEVIWNFKIKEGQSLATPHPADFAIRFESQTWKVPNVLDTFDGYIQKDLVQAFPNKAKTDYDPTEEELQFLWYLVEYYDLLSMPADMHPIPTGDTYVSILPNCEYTITIRANGKTYTIKGDRNTCHAEGEENRRFGAFINNIQGFMTSTGQWQSLPEAVGGYD